MSLNEKQFKFTLAISSLIVFAYNQGYTLSQGDGYRNPRVFGIPGIFKGYGHKNSTHKYRLAQDYNLFINGKWVKSGRHKAWKILHDYWVLLGGSEIITKDPNHFSFEHNGVK
jgi:hypothetical protein